MKDNTKRVYVIFSNGFDWDTKTVGEDIYKGMYDTYDEAKEALAKLIINSSPDEDFYIYDARLKLESVTKFDEEEDD